MSNQIQNLKFKYERIILIAILLLSAFLRFYNLMHDAPYFFNPDERNMASAITRFSLPSNVREIPSCIFSEFFNNRPTTNDQRPETQCSLNPHFFAYGQFPLYLAFASDQIVKPLTQLVPSQPTTHNPQLTTNFPSAIFWLRFYSALSSTLTVLIVFLTSRKLFTFHSHPELVEWVSLFAAAGAAFTPGLIQSAHFGTTESLLTFFFMMSVYLSVSYLGRLSQLRFILLTSLTIGLSLGSKLTGLFFFIPPGLSLMIRFIELFGKRVIFIKRLKRSLAYCLVGLLILVGSITVAVVSSPYNLVEWQDFQSAVFGYEADVATGKFEAFYTRQFIGTTPILFQIQKIFPHQLGWPIFILGTLGFLFINLHLIHKIVLFVLHKVQSSKSKVQSASWRTKFKIFHFKLSFCILNFTFLTYLIPNASLFAKWTRFMTPLLPFFSIFAVLGVLQIYQLILSLWGKIQSSKFKVKSASWRTKFKIFNSKLSLYTLNFTLLTISVLPGLAFFSIYTRQDSRVTASRWIYENIPDGSYVLSETANVVDIPLGIPTHNPQPTTHNYTVISFDFYHLNENPQLSEDLYKHLFRSNYIFIPSRRIFANHIPQPQQFPQLTRYYDLLFSGKLGFEKVAEISSFPTLGVGPLKVEFSDEDAEETATVFDHPVIRIYKKVRQLDINEYALLFENEKTFAPNQ